MGKQLISTAMYSGKIIDCRVLSLNLEFYDFSAERVLAMSEDIINWINSAFDDDFIVRRRVKRRIVSENKVLSAVRDNLMSNNYVSYMVDAMAECSVVYNVSTFQNYFRNLRDCYGSGKYEIPTRTSIDYPEYWNSVFTNVEKDAEAFKTKLVQLFREENRKKMAGYVLPDIQALLSVEPYYRKPNHYYGSFGIDISAFCLNAHIDEMAEELVKFSSYLSNTYVKMNARVSLQPPTPNAYTSVFPCSRNYDGSHEIANCTENEWYRTYYLQGVEWFNVISPLTRQHFEDSILDTDLKGIIFSEGRDGNFFLKSAKRILSYDISDALEMKKLLYPALSPGMSVIPYRVLFHSDIYMDSMSVFPRSDWAIVPVFEDEIHVIGRSVAFISN